MDKSSISTNLGIAVTIEVLCDFVSMSHIAERVLSDLKVLGSAKFKMVLNSLLSINGSNSIRVVACEDKSIYIISKCKYCQSLRANGFVIQ